MPAFLHLWRWHLSIRANSERQCQDSYQDSSNIFVMNYTRQHTGCMCPVKYTQ